MAFIALLLLPAITVGPLFGSPIGLPLPSSAPNSISEDDLQDVDQPRFPRYKCEIGDSPDLIGCVCSCGAVDSFGVCQLPDHPQPGCKSYINAAVMMAVNSKRNKNSPAASTVSSVVPIVAVASSSTEADASSTSSSTMSDHDAHPRKECTPGESPAIVGCSCYCGTVDGAGVCQIPDHPQESCTSEINEAVKAAIGNKDMKELTAIEDTREVEEEEQATEGRGQKNQEKQRTTLIDEMLEFISPFYIIQTLFKIF